MRSAHRSIAVMTAVLSILFVVAVPGHASDVNRVATFTGTWEVNPGIWAPGFGPPQNSEWRLTSDLCQDAAGPGGTPCLLDVSGYVGAIASPGGFNLGTWCNGWHSGWGGSGTFTDSQGKVYDIDSLGWNAMMSPVAGLVGRWSDSSTGANGTLIILVGPNPSTEVGGCYLQDSDEFSQFPSLLVMT